MKIAWVTPFSTRSAIGRFSRLVTAALERQGHAVTVVRSEAPDLLSEEAHPHPGPVLPWTALAGEPGRAGDFDVLVYNAGDNYLFHAGVIALLPKHPGAVVFHDFYLLNLFHAWRHFGAGPDADAVADALYGPGSAEAILELIARPDHMAEAADRFPMTEWIAAQADGAVAHAGFYADRLRRAAPGPVTVLPLAYDTLGAFTPLHERPPSRPLTVLTVGNVNPNKRVDSVLQAIGGSDALRGACRYRVVGAVEEGERRRLQDVAALVGVADLTITGAVPDAVLHAEMEAADVIACLRRPPLEGASASAVEAMLSGRPVLVSEGGFYADLPDHLVFKVRPETEVADVRRHLLALREDPRLGALVGRRAAAWAARTFAPDAYAARLVPFLEEVVRGQPLLRTAARLGRTAAGLGLGPDDPLLGRLAGVMDGLFRPPGG